MQHMLTENIGLMTSRQVLNEFRHAFISTNMVNYNFIDLAGKFGTGFFFPLYLYQKARSPRQRFTFGRAMMLFEPQAEYVVKKPNISQALFDNLKKEFKKEPSSEQIFYYIYAILYSNIYRTKYAEFLKIDFPRVPFTKDYKRFMQMAKYGEQLVELHLLKSSEIDTPIARFQGKGNDKVEKLRYNPPISPLKLRGDERGVTAGGMESGRLYINQTQYFEGIAPEVWEYQIGGYRVCEKWLKDRKEKILSLDDIKHYLKIVSALLRTIEAQKKIDDAYPEVEKNILRFENN
jgi:predicted helicase